MARTASPNFTIAQLEQLLQGRRSELSRLERQRSGIAKKLNRIDARIAALGGNGRRGGGGGTGGGRMTAGGRVRNEKSLNDTIEQVLGKNGKPMGVGDITDAVRAAGYRTNSANFRSIVNQTLIKDKRFASSERGMYHLKK
jgi:hypothetical protein